jgi:hypothetical protein
MRFCARPGCTAEATFAVGFDPVARVAWLGELTDTAPIVLCDSHAARLRLPRGWVGRDERGTEPALWLAVDTAVEPPVTARRRRRRVDVATSPDEPLPLFVGRHDPVTHLADALFRAHATADPSVEHADSPLLARAFRAAGLG